MTVSETHNAIRLGCVTGTDSALADMSRNYWPGMQSDVPYGRAIGRATCMSQKVCNDCN